MRKILATLVASLFATSVFAQTTETRAIARVDEATGQVLQDAARAQAEAKARKAPAEQDAANASKAGAKAVKADEAEAMHEANNDNMRSAATQ